MYRGRGRGRRRGQGQERVQVTDAMRHEVEDDDETQAPDTEDRLEDINVHIAHGEGSSSEQLPELVPDRLWFSKPQVVKSVTASFELNYNYPYMNYSEVQDHVKEQWFRTFKTFYKWKPEIEHLVRREYDHKCAVRLKDQVNKAAKKPANKVKWMSADTHKELIAMRNNPDFQSRSKRNRANKVGGSEKSGGSINPGHRQGSISSAEYAHRLARENGGELPTAADLYIRTHSRKEGEGRVLASEKAKQTMAEYERLRSEYRTHGNNRPDNEVFFEAVGGYQKGKVYGLGESASIYFERSSKTSRSTPSVSSHYTEPVIVPLLDDLRFQIGRLDENTTKTLQQQVVMSEHMERMEQWRQDQMAHMQFFEQWRQTQASNTAQQHQQLAEISRRNEEMWKWYLGMSQTQQQCGSFPPPHNRDPRDPPDSGNGASGFFPVY